MKWSLGVRSLSLLFSVAIAVVSVGQAAPPNWKVEAAGTATLANLDLVHFTRTDIDAFNGTSSHLGKFTGAGYHILDLVTGEFAGVATYTAANGDTMNVEYAGQLFPSGDSNFPYGALANVEITGGTGRFANANGAGVLTGGFNGGVPLGEVFFDVEGTLSTK
jgi:hypothetical protein